MRQDIKEKIDAFIAQLYTGDQEADIEIAKYLIDKAFSRDDSNKEVLTFKEMSRYGIIYAINKQVLHPLGLALSWEVDRNISEGCLIADDFIWDYTQRIHDEENVKLQYFKDNRIDILSRLLGDRGVKSL